MTELQYNDVSALREALAGTVLEPGDAGYDEARAIWNGAIDRKPALFAKVANAFDVAAAVRFARAAGVELSVRGGAHSTAGAALAEGGVTIDLSGLRTVTVDPARRVMVAGGGATWAEVDAAAQEHGLAVTGGAISHTGIGGLTLGGGFGWLSRKAGLTCDNLLAAEVVTADGQIVRASADEDPELLWALKGGGGNFGVVTSFEYQLHHVGPMVNLGLFFFGLDQGREVLQFVREFTRDLPDDIGVVIVGLNAPPAPFVPEAFHFAPGYLIAVAGFGTPDDHAAVVSPIRQAVTPLFEFVTPIPYVALQQMLDESAPWGILAYQKALYLDELSDGAVDVIVDQQPQKASPMSLMLMFAMGGQFARVADDATAFGGRRSTRFVVNIDAIAPTPELHEADTEWVRRYWAELVNFAIDEGAYVNFMSEYEDDRVRAAYGEEKYRRLAAVKAKHDPDNVFHLNANIQPAV